MTSTEPEPEPRGPAVLRSSAAGMAHPALATWASPSPRDALGTVSCARGSGETCVVHVSIPGPVLI